MSDVHSRLAALGVALPELLLPKKDLDLLRWAVIACDQFTQDRTYWEEVKNYTKGFPSTLSLIFPEIFLEDGGEEGKNKRILEIKRTMSAYISEGLFDAQKPLCLYVERQTPKHPKRRGLVLLVDLEQYNWEPESRLLIRSTDGTIKERLPPRVEIRRDAPLELPHVLLLIDDEKDCLIPSLGEIAIKQPPLYETPLMMKSGAISGWALDTDEALITLAEGLENLANMAGQRYGSFKTGESPFLFAVGDGNHSLASAKAVWEEYKRAHVAEANLENHPARWALVEVENLYDPGISFEPIHRVIFGAEPSELLEVLAAGKNITFRQDTQQEPKIDRIIWIENSSQDIVTISLEALLEGYVKEKGLSIDYIHGEDEVFRLAADSTRPAVGIILPPLRKEGLFKTVAQSGPLPRKSFSMGESWEKRFYLESRRLF